MRCGQGGRPLIVYVPRASRAVRRGDRPDNPLRPMGISECFDRSRCPWHVSRNLRRKEAARARAAARRPNLRPRVFARDGGVCVDCGQVHPEWEGDHQLALIDGGPHELDNMATRCPADHRSKTAQEARLRSRRYRNGELIA